MKIVTKERVGRHFYKILSIVLSIGLWGYVISMESTQKERSLEVEYLLPAGVSVAEEAVREVVVKFKGPRAFMRTFLNREDKIFVDLRKESIEKGRVITKRLGATDIPAVPGISVIDITPDVVRVKLDKKMKKLVTITPQLLSDVGQNYQLISWEIVPSSIELEGPVELIENLENVSTAPISFKGLTGPGVIDVVLKNDESKIKQSQDVRPVLKFVIKPTKANLSLNNIKIRFLSSQKLINVSHRTASIVVLADAGEKADVRKKDVILVADIPDGTKGNTKIKLKATLPDGVHLLKIYPEFISVTVK